MAIFAVAGVVWLIHPWYPVEDLAITELEVRRIGRHFPLSGAYSSLPFRHPGPALFLSLHLPYQLFGERPSALLAANLWIVGMFAASTLALARRLGGEKLAVLMALGFATWSLATGLPILLQPWNPYVGAVPTAFLILLGWSMVEGSARALPLAIATGSWLVQAHIQFLPVAAAVVTAGVVILAVRTRSSPDASARRAFRRSVQLGMAVGLLFWAPPMIDVVIHGGESNPARIVAYVQEGTGDPPIASSDLVGIIRSELSGRPTWAGGGTPYGRFFMPVARPAPWMVVPMLGALVLCAWRRRWREVRGIAAAFWALVAGFFGLARITGTIGPWYLVAVEAASITLAATVLSALAGVAGDEIGRRVGSVGRERGDGTGVLRWVRVTGCGVALVALAVAVAALDHPYEEVSTASAGRRALPAIEERLEGRPVLIEGRWSLVGWVYSVLAVELERAGHDVHVRTVREDKFPADMEAEPPPDAQRFVVFTDPPGGMVWSEGVEVVADFTYSFDPDFPATRLVIVEAPLDSPVQDPAP